MASRLFMSFVVVAATALATTAAWAQQPAPAASAGCTGNEQFSDDFTQANDPTWPVPRDDIAIGGGKFQGKAPVTKWNWAITAAVNVGDADICVDLSVNPVSDPTQTYGGVVFWLGGGDPDSPNFYQVMIDPAGDASLQAIQNKKLTQPVSWRKAASLKTGANVVNSIRITLKGNKISIYFNGQPWYTNLSGVQPQGGGEWGLQFTSEKAAPNVWTFSNLKVTDPSQ